MRQWLKTLVFLLVLALGCIAGLYAPDGAIVVLLIGGVIMYTLGQL